MKAIDLIDTLIIAQVMKNNMPRKIVIEKRLYEAVRNEAMAQEVNLPPMVYRGIRIIASKDIKPGTAIVSSVLEAVDSEVVNIFGYEKVFNGSNKNCSVCNMPGTVWKEPGQTGVLTSLIACKNGDCMMNNIQFDLVDWNEKRPGEQRNDSE